MMSRLAAIFGNFSTPFVWNTVPPPLGGGTFVLLIFVSHRLTSSTSMRAMVIIHYQYDSGLQPHFLVYKVTIELGVSGLSSKIYLKMLCFTAQTSTHYAHYICSNCA